MQLVRIFVLYLVNCITVNCKLLAEACCYKSSYGLWRSTVSSLSGSRQSMVTKQSLVHFFSWLH